MKSLRLLITVKGALAAKAVAVQQHLTERYPTLMRPLTLRNSDYNEYFTPGSLLVEIGAAGNSLDEALKAVRVFGEGFAEVVTGK